MGTEFCVGQKARFSRRIHGFQPDIQVRLQGVFCHVCDSKGAYSGSFGGFCRIDSGLGFTGF